MKKKKYLIPIRIMVTACAAFGWWGLLYPELTMTPSTLNVVYEEDSVQEMPLEWDLDEDIYFELLEADRSQIRFKSRLLMRLNALQEQGRGIHESGK